MASRVALLLALGLGLAGCGSDDDGGGEAGAPAIRERSGVESAQPAPNGAAKGKVGKAKKSAGSSLPPAAQVDLAIKAVLASGVPGLACDRHATERYLESSFGGRGGCVRSTVPPSAATSVEVSEVRIDGDAAKALAVPTGGPSDGERIRVELVRGGGVWKIDSLRSNAPVGP